MEMLNPALAIFWMVASCRLPFGNPNRKMFFLAIIGLRFGACGPSRRNFISKHSVINNYRCQMIPHNRFSVRLGRDQARKRGSSAETTSSKVGK